MDSARLVVGLMSGTSLDGVDGVLAEIGGDRPLRVRRHLHQPFPAMLRAELLMLNDAGGSDELHRASLAANGVAAAYSEMVAALLSDTGVDAGQVAAIGAHGQTVRHRPAADPAEAYTLQLLNGALLAERTGIDVVCDFRSRDLAAGGQGAPLVPAFHAALFPDAADRALLNLGGIANLTLLSGDGGVTGFDCGPANALLDGWCERHTGRRFDEDGRFAASASPDAELLSHLRSAPYFQLPPPKSTGRDLFNMGWLDAMLAGGPARPPEVVQSTLMQLTVATVADDLETHHPASRELYVCGGGAHNLEMLRRLGEALPGLRVATTAAIGLPPDQVEASAFAWLADVFLRRAAGNRPAVTGARGPRVLGALYPGALRA